MKLVPVISFALVLGLCLTTVTQAQHDDLVNAGSFYSGFGFGAPVDIYSPFTMGMGLTGVATYSPMSPNVSNPAQWGVGNLTQGNLAMALTNFRAQDRFNSARNSLFAIENFQMILPIQRNRLGVSIGFSPVSRSDFQRIDEGSFHSVPGLELPEVDHATITTGSGGVNRFEVGTGIRLTNFLSVGYAFSVHILSLKQDISTFFSDNRYRSSSVDRVTEGYGVGHRFGVFTHFDGLFRNSDQILFGAAIDLPVSIDTDRSLRVLQIVDGTRTRIDLNEGAAGREGKIQIPLEFNTGLTYNLNRFVSFATELQFQKWGSAEYSYNSEQQSWYKDKFKAGAGFQYHPYRVDQPGGFFSNFMYSLGATYDTGHLSIEGQDIETLFLNAGIGLPSRQFASSIDLSFHYGIRGTDSGNLVKENIWGFKLSLNLAEQMFVRRRFQ